MPYLGLYICLLAASIYPWYQCKELPCIKDYPGPMLLNKWPKENRWFYQYSRWLIFLQCTEAICVTKFFFLIFCALYIFVPIGIIQFPDSWTERGVQSLFFHFLSVLLLFCFCSETFWGNRAKGNFFCAADFVYSEINGSLNDKHSLAYNCFFHSKSIDLLSLEDPPKIWDNLNVSKSVWIETSNVIDMMDFWHFDKLWFN